MENSGAGEKGSAVQGVQLLSTAPNNHPNPIKDIEIFF